MAHKNYQNHRLVPEQPPVKLVSPNTADSRYNISYCIEFFVGR